jgi:hypothetical protein
VNLLLTPHVAHHTQQDKPFCNGCAEPPFAAVSPKTVVSGGRGACGRGVWWPFDLCNRVRSASTTSNRASPAPLLRGEPEVALVAWRRVESSPLGEEPPAGLLRNQGPYRLVGPIQRRAFTIARERSGATPIRLTRTPSVAGSWEGAGWRTQRSR